MIRGMYSATAGMMTMLSRVQTIANNLALNALRNRKRRPVLPLELQQSGGDVPTTTAVPAQTRDQPPAHNLQQQELAAVIRDALDGLNERQRVAIVLNKFEDMNYADISEVMGLSTKAVKSLLSRARVKLREALQGYIYMDGDPPPPDDAGPEDE